MAHTFLQRKHPSQLQTVTSPITLNGTFIKGLQSTRWPGRCQEIADPNAPGTTWFLDGAHTVESLTCGMEWFASSGVGIRADSSTSVPHKRFELMPTNVYVQREDYPCSYLQLYQWPLWAHFLGHNTGYYPITAAAPRNYLRFQGFL
jgi:hypothetical protein